MISLEGRADSPPLRLPLRRRRLWSQRLARSQRRQLVATGVALGLGLMAYWPGWVTGHRSGLPNRLLDSRLVVQTAWRDLRGVPPTPGGKDQNTPLVVWLLSSKVAYPNQGKRVSREVLATVLRALPSERAPVVGIDVVLDDDGAQPVQPVATKALAELIQTQRRKVLFNITMHDNSQRPGAVGVASLPSPELRKAGLKSFDGTLGIPENSLLSSEFPLQLIGAVGRNSFAGVLAFGVPAKAAGEGLPAGSVIDWSIDWLAPSVIQVVWIGEKQFNSLRSAAPPLPPGARVLVGVDRRGLAGEGASKGSAEPASDLYPVPDALFDQPSWQAFKEDPVSWLNSDGGDKNHLPGPVLQAVWSESLRRGHWLTPLAPLPTMALASGLGVLLAAGLERRRHHLLTLTLISLLAVPVSLELALSLRVLVPLLFPLGALWASCLSRRERGG